MRLSDLVSNALEELKQTGIDNPALDARLLVAHVLGLDRAALLSQSERDVTDNEYETIAALIVRRAKGESVARIIGHREFWGLDFGLNEATLEPRPDSEALIEGILRRLKEHRHSGESRNPAPCVCTAHASSNAHTSIPIKLLDLGTGTGCLLLALLHELPNALGVGIDVAPRAIEQATTNAKTLGLDKRALFHIGSWFDDVEGTFDIIVSNPPYIPTADIPKLQRDVRDFDPRRALDGGADGLKVYRHLIPKLAAHLAPDGLVAFEVGQGQAWPVTNLLRDAGFADIEIHKDLGGIERCITGRLIS